MAFSKDWSRNPRRRSAEAHDLVEALNEVDEVLHSADESKNDLAGG